jgi:Flp pilus assembly protein TadG
MVLLTPLLVLLTLFVVYLGRAGGGTEQVRHAADVAARTASVLSTAKMSAGATVAAQADLTNNGVNCSSTSVAVAVNDSPGSASVTVTVSCVINQAGLSMLGLADRTVTASSTEVIDRYRAG